MVTSFSFLVLSSSFFNSLLLELRDFALAFHFFLLFWKSPAEGFCHKIAAFIIDTCD